MHCFYQEYLIRIRLTELVVSSTNLLNDGKIAFGVDGETFTGVNPRELAKKTGGMLSFGTGCTKGYRRGVAAIPRDSLPMIGISSKAAEYVQLIVMVTDEVRYHEAPYGNVTKEMKDGTYTICGILHDGYKPTLTPFITKSSIPLFVDIFIIQIQIQKYKISQKCSKEMYEALV